MSAQLPELSLLAAGLTCAAGSSRAEALAAYRGPDHFIARNPALIGLDGAPLTIAAVIAPEEERNELARTYLLIETAFLDMMGQLAARGIRKAAPVTLMLPPAFNQPQPRDWLAATLRERLGERIGTLGFVHGGAAEAMLALARLAQTPEDELGYVIAAESLIPSRAIDDLMSRKRLFSSENPWGTIPGEAAVALAVLPGRRENLPGLRLAFAQEPERADDRARGIRGRGLADALAALRDPAHPPAAIWSDQNGDRGETEEFGFAVTASGPELAALADRAELPMARLGHSGCAMALTSLALALDGPPALVTASSQGPLRAAALLLPAPNTGSTSNPTSSPAAPQEMLP
ncbi:hypothetical protein [Paracoccus aminophilus]|uniref:Beta-ketoacyl synthase N-terminal domain-containing protein n=1 Tax=Paracoccus aminophilus JCM 7686 TaxID=1367847 RepID=S5Y054_PARAH|nr:hypothetical protein [Paracoccus aminophilus]AGT09065.1 hypothetical protein JCM7686_1964 [Paracoccus aminophilus JCM 7686]